MPPREAFWHALATVMPAVLIACMIFLFARNIDAEMWSIYLVIILVPAAFLLLLIFYRYRKGRERPQLTRRRHLISAIAYGALALGYLVLCIVRLKDGWRSWYTWIFAAAWLLIALDHLQRAHKKRHSHQIEQAEPPTTS